ncbi:hypothetical protein DL93DRAFT_567284 [Clavulina sp. PMI_390]|nr:hypothetical protein DL93DRAFT_567284 [Clavulina sp. PMI_390]
MVTFGITYNIYSVKQLIAGFPGIVAGQPPKAKYIKVGLRKIETLLGGGLANSFSMIVGAGWQDIWTAKESWESIGPKAIPFEIPIPEQIPSSVADENGSIIRYEIAAEIGVKYKKGLFRRETSSTFEATAQIVIRKHELHPTWPIYLEGDIRNVQKNGFDFTVERQNICHGPGDIIKIKATLKSSAGSGTIRLYEMVLRETIKYHQYTHLHTTDPRHTSAPVVRSTLIGMEKLPVQVAIHPGLSDTVDLQCTIPITHKTTTVVTANNVEIVYNLAVQTILEDQTELAIDNIPVVISNWPQEISENIVQTIGYEPNLCRNHSPRPISQETMDLPPSTTTLSALLDSISENSYDGTSVSTMNLFHQPGDYNPLRPS